MLLELWDKSAKVSFDKKVLNELVSLRFLEMHRHVCILGPVGVGKTFLASALGHIACRHGYNVKFARADETLERLRQSRFDNRVTRRCSPSRRSTSPPSTTSRSSR